MPDRGRTGALCSVAAVVALGLLPSACNVGDHEPIVGESAPRAPDGRPDLSGTFDVSTLTPLQRPEGFGERYYLTDEEANALIEGERSWRELAAEPSDPNRPAPPVKAPGATGVVNPIWVSRGSLPTRIADTWRSSIIVDPPNGRFPEITAREAAARADAAAAFHEDDGTAWWLETDRPGPYDGPESRNRWERCLLVTPPAAGPPVVPAHENNIKRIIQTPDHVMIFSEMIHDVRVVRLDDEHDPPQLRKWLGDSIGHWDGDTLVVDTINFNDTPALRSATRDLHVIERFTRIDRETIHYRFTVADPNVWREAWTGEYLWHRTDERAFEYACHEANYSMTATLRGGRKLEELWSSERDSK